jgi:hypothetical protein
LKEIGRLCIGLCGLRASFAGNQARNRRPRHAPMLSARKIQHQAGDHEQQLARPAKYAAAVNIQHAGKDPIADWFIRIDLRRNQPSLRFTSTSQKRDPRGRV